MKRKRGGCVCVVELGPIGNQAFGVPVGATDEAIAFVVATIEHEKLSGTRIVERYNRSIKITNYETGAGDAAAVARGIMIGLGLKRVPGNKNTYHAFSRELVDDAMTRVLLEEGTTEDSEESDDIPHRVENNSTSGEESSDPQDCVENHSESVEEISSSDFSESDDSFLSSGETSEE